MNLIKPQKLNKGDKVATVSLSWGGAGEKDILWRYYQGKERMEKLFGLQVVEMPNALKDADYVYNHPEKRAKDLMQAFADDSIKAVISCIGGSDSIRMLPYIDYNLIKNHPKIFTGYSDTTVAHFICIKAGISSFYGLSVLNDFAENVAMSDYTVNAINKVFFSSDVIGDIPPSKTWTAQRLKWIVDNKDIQRTFEPNTGYELLQGKGIVKGRLIGGCLEVIEYIKGTDLFPTHDLFNNAILFLETSEVIAPVWLVEDVIRNYGSMGILNRISGIFFGKPQGGMLYEEYKPVIKKVLAEFGCSDIPVLYNGSFGHNEPKAILPYGALAEIDCDNKKFTILESGVV